MSKSTRSLLEYFGIDPKDHGFKDDENYNASDVLRYNGVNANTDLRKKITKLIAISKKYFHYNKMENGRWSEKGNNSCSICADESFGYNDSANSYNLCPDDYGAD